MKNVIKRAFSNLLIEPHLHLRRYTLPVITFKNAPVVRTIILLLCSNVFMTFAWYYHLKHTGWPLWQAILLSWAIAFFEYCLMVPANRAGFLSGFSAFQLKIIQEVITLVVFSVFAVVVLKEPFHVKYLFSFLFLMGAVYFMFKS